jgi:hypothetical protein
MTMARVKLTIEEKAVRKKARTAFSFSDQAYQHYNPEKEGWGHQDQWEEVARRVFGLAKLRRPGTTNKWLLALGLEAMPASLQILVKAFHKQMFVAHPDYGGSNQAARDTMEAFQTLKARFS